MPTDAFMVFIPNSGPIPTSESTIDFGAGLRTADPFPGSTSLTNQNFFEIFDYSLDVEQTLNITSTGSGAGRIVFNPLSVTRRVDLFSETLFLNSAAGTPFKYVDLLLRKSTGDGDGASATYLAYRFGLCAVQSMSWSYDEESPREVVDFEYGTLSIAYAKQAPNGTFSQPVIVGWDRVRNVRI